MSLNSIDAIETAILDKQAEVDLAEAAYKAELAALRLLLVRTALGLSWLDDRRERLKIARFLYWQANAPVWAVAAGMMMDRLDRDGPFDALEDVFKRKIHLFRKIIGPHSYVTCSGCKKPNCAPITSRNGLPGNPGYKYAKSPICDDCLERKAISARDAVYAAGMQEDFWRQRRIQEAEECERLAAKANLAEHELERLYELLVRKREHDAWNERRSLTEDDR